MAKKNIKKAKQQPNNLKKTAPKSKPATNQVEISELEPLNETDQLDEQPIKETQDENTETFAPDALEENGVQTETKSEELFFAPKSDEPIEIYYELGEEAAEVVAEQSITQAAELNEVIESTPEPETKPKKTRKSKIGTATSAILAGCSYHYFRKYFKKQFDIANIKVRFVKQATGYNGHMEVTEADKEKAIELLETIKSNNPTVKNLYWDIAIG